MSLTVQVSGTDLSVSQTGTTAVTVSSTGIVGATGATGPSGSQGAQGAAGNNGNNGAQGAASNVAGPQGAPGNNSNVAGPQGAQGAPGTSGTSTFPYSGTAQITGSLEILSTTSNAITTTSDGGIKVVRHSSAFGLQNTVWGGYLYPLSATALYNQAGSIFGTTKNPLALQPLSTAQDIALITVNHGANVFVSASNEIYLGFGSSSPAKNYVRDLLVISGSLQGTVRPLTITSSTASLNMSGSNFFTLQLVNGINTHINVNSPLPGQTVNLRVNTTGSGTVTFSSVVKQASGSNYIPTTGTGVDILTLIAFDNSNVFLANVKNLI